MASSASTPPPDPSTTPATDDPKGTAPAAPKASGGSQRDLWELLRDTYGLFDRRALGFARLMIGFYLIMDLVRRTDAWMDMFSTTGVLPNNVNLWRPQSSLAWTLLNGFSTAPELVALWLVIFVTFVCLFIGYQTKLAQILAVVFVTSMNGRVLLIENGGYVVQNLLVMWTAFLPLGDRFSVDAMVRSMRRTREASEDDLNDRDNLFDEERPHVYRTLMGLVILLQLSAIYYFNVIHKTGPAWRNGTAVHYVLYVDRMVTPGIAHIRDYIPNWAIIFMTKSTLALEATIAVMLLSPLGRVWARRMAIVSINCLHIAFGTVFVLGPFAWAACCFSTLLFSYEDWEAAKRAMRRAHRQRTVRYDARSPAAFHLCRLLRRCDHMELLTFRAADGVRTGVSIERPDGSRAEGSLALSEIVAALPLGPIVAWSFRLPGKRHAIDALMPWLLGARGSRFFGMRLPRGEAVLAPDRSAVSRTGRTALSALREVMVAFMFAAAINQAMMELWVINRRWKMTQPEPLRTLAQKLRFLQGWFMFSPNPVMDDGSLVVDAITVDGRHIDPFTQQEPMFDLLHAKSLRHNQIWCDYFNRIHLPGNSAYRDAMKEYMFRLPERTGNPNDAIVSGDVYWVQDMNPKWGQTESYDEQRKKLFSFAAPGHAVAPQADVDADQGAARRVPVTERRERSRLDMKPIAKPGEGAGENVEADPK